MIAHVCCFHTISPGTARCCKKNDNGRCHLTISYCQERGIKEVDHPTTNDQKNLIQAAYLVSRSLHHLMQKIEEKDNDVSFRVEQHEIAQKAAEIERLRQLLHKTQALAEKVADVRDEALTEVRKLKTLMKRSGVWVCKCGESSFGVSCWKCELKKP